MSRSRLPPTPSMSGEFVVKDQPAIEGTDVFALPPAAIETATSRRSSKSDHLPASPVSPDFMALGRSASKQSSAGAGAGAGTKRPLEDFDLPPPPTRTRKIIQMKPKTQQSAPAKSNTAPTGGKGSKESGKAAAAASNSAPAPANGGKKKQPSATSAAGRKIARKTAHSLIERRRRSKMNEEFTTLKDMIPACTGQEMHKLAILQVSLKHSNEKRRNIDKIKASIDYVNYLEQCIKDLKTAGGRHSAVPPRLPPAPPSVTSPEFLEELADSEHEASVSPELLPESSQVHDTSPSFSPRTVPSNGTTYDFVPTTILPSPALGPNHPTEAHQSWPASANTSPALQPSRQSNASADADVDASAALLMLNQDRRGTADSIADKVTEASLESGNRETRVQEPGRRMGMSVKDLLIS